MMKTARLILSSAILALSACVPAVRDPAPAPIPAPAVPIPAPAPSAPADSDNPPVGSAAMLSSRTILDNASAAPTLSTFVAAMRAGGLAPVLAGPGPVTVFVPTNDAFSRLAPGMIDTLLKPENRATLVKLLNYHVISGSVGADQLRDMIARGGGAVALTTVEGSTLTVRMEGTAIALTDANGTKFYVETPDIRQANGVMHVINGVAVPKL